jgi:NAD(P)-dependent dehydrogenase (short-subunit alcohol dehydrogenase family)
MGIAVVTGGGRGIGAAIAKRLEEDGHVVHRLDQNPGPGVTVCNITDEAAVIRVAEQIAADGPVMRREVTVEMTGTFDSVFGVVDAAEAVDQLVTPRSIEIVVMSSPAEQATLGNPAVRATMIFEEWFDRQAKPAQEARP